MPSGGRRVQFGDKCKNCGVEIQSYNAAYKGDAPRYMQSRCRSCYRARRDSLPSRTKEARARQWTEWKWGLSPGEYNRRVELQLSGCAVCKQPCDVRDRLAVDHDHRTGRIRDLLCFRCNAVLGQVDDDEELLFALIEYLKRHNEKAAG